MIVFSRMFLRKHLFIVIGLLVLCGGERVCRFITFIPLCFYLSSWLWFIGAILLSTDRGLQVTLREAARLKKEKMESLPGFHFMRAYHDIFYLFNSSLAWSHRGPGRDGRRGVGGRCKTLPCPCFFGIFFIRLTGWSGL